MEFKPYEAKPVTRQAFQITDEHEFTCLGGSDWLIGPANAGNNTVQMIRFKAHQAVEKGDWVVRLTDDDTYHCTDAVFRERNIVND